MRRMLLATAMLCGVALSAAATMPTRAYAQAPDTETPPPPPPPAADAPPPGDGGAPAAPMPPKKPMMHMSHMGGGASNISPGDTRSDIAPKLPAPMVGADDGADAYLAAAKRAIRAHRTGEAQQALEMAETRMLDRSVPADEGSAAIKGPRVDAVKMALDSLSRKDMAGANDAIDKAMEGHRDGEGMKMHHPGMKMHMHHMPKDHMGKDHMSKGAMPEGDMPNGDMPPPPPPGH